MGRQKQEPVVGVFSRQVCSAPIQLLDYDSDILMAEMTLLLDQVTKGASGVAQVTMPSKRANTLFGAWSFGLRRVRVAHASA